MRQRPRACSASSRILLRTPGGVATRVRKSSNACRISEVSAVEVDVRMHETAAQWLRTAPGSFGQAPRPGPQGGCGVVLSAGRWLGSMFFVRCACMHSSRAAKGGRGGGFALKGLLFKAEAATRGLCLSVHPAAQEVRVECACLPQVAL